VTKRRERAIDENIASGKKWNSKPSKIDFDQQFMSAEYRSGYNEGYKHGLRGAAICLLVAGAMIMVFN
jgi:hypothetical protein